VWEISEKGRQRLVEQQKVGKKQMHISERIVNGIDEIVRLVRFPCWQTTSAVEREVKQALRRTHAGVNRAEIRSCLTRHMGISGSTTERWIDCAKAFIDVTSCAVPIAIGGPKRHRERRCERDDVEGAAGTDRGGDHQFAGQAIRRRV
jgi:hypothetical protein